MHKLCGGKVPKLHEDIIDDKDKSLIEDIQKTKTRIEKFIGEFKFRDALFEVIDLARKGNKYMQEKQPWILAKQTNGEGQTTEAAQKAIDNCLHICLQLCANLSIFINPFLPFTAQKMIYMMKVKEKMLEWENAGKLKLLSVGYTLRPPELLFRKIEDAEINAQIEKLRSGSVDAAASMPATIINKNEVLKMEESGPPVNQVKSTIQFDDFAKIDLKTGTILSAEKVEKADKLLKLEIDLGFEKRTIVSGIALHFKPEDIIGKQVVVVANLAPRKMRGIESNGMILMAEDNNGALHFVSPSDTIDPGASVT